jgi:3-oxoacyl-[acyl-carrier-protein] synthase III
MSVLFGDGGAAMILEANDSGDGRGVLGCYLFSMAALLANSGWTNHLLRDNPTPFRLNFFSRGNFILG